ncbi:MAG: Npt1/Npt2 family nucleotide transporter [Rickettsiaceae bacterium]
MSSISENIQPKNTFSEPPSPPITYYKKILDYLWPIARSELPKFLSITLLMFCILGIQNLIRAMKDSVINTMMGTETISFLKFWGVLPAAFLVTIIYVKLVSVMKGENIFYLTMSTFLGFFLLFAFYLFPHHKELHLDPQIASKLIVNSPNLKWFILLLSNWSFSLFYIIAELWPNAIFALLFWQFVNKITSVDESKRFYPLFGLLGQTGLYLSGTFLLNLPEINSYSQKIFALSSAKSVITIQIVVSVVTVLGVIALIIFWFLNHKILDTTTTSNLKFKVKKNQLSLKESIQIVAGSRYIRLIAILLICYGMAINLIEGPWKSEASKIYKTPTEFAAFIGNYLSYTGILTLCFVVLGSNIVRKLGWLSAAIITPIMVLVTGLGFFVVVNFNLVATFMMVSFACRDPIILAITIGAIQNILSKSSKYTLFDSTKEMSYVPLEEPIQTRGKAAADMIGTKLGKSGGAFLQSIIFVIFPAATYQSISTFLMVAFIAISIVWLWAVLELNKEYKIKCSKAAERSNVV